MKAGFDYFETKPGTFQSFSSTPLPADFFNPGSDPFSGTIFLQGVPLAPDSSADTIVQRTMNALWDLPDIWYDTVPIELVALSLRSTSPITITYGGGFTEQWDVVVAPSPTFHPQGSMTITKTDPQGGTFQSILPVSPFLTFTDITDPNQVRRLDLGQFNFALQFRADNVPWTYKVPKELFESKGFCPSCGPNGEPVLTTEEAIIAQHFIEPARKISLPREDCKVKVTLQTVTYNGENIGDDWRYKITVHGKATDVAEHTFGPPPDSESLELVVFNGVIGKKNTDVKVHIVVKATAVDSFDNDNAQEEATYTEHCPSTDTQSITVNVYEDEDKTTNPAILKFTFFIELC